MARSTRRGRKAARTAPRKAAPSKARRRKPKPAATARERRPAAAKRLAAERQRLSRRRGDDMGLASLSAELSADRQRARDAVHERDISGT